MNEIDKDETVYKEMASELKTRRFSNVFASYEIELQDTFNGSIDLTFDIGTPNNGKVAKILHQKHDGTYEIFKETVKDGKVTITVTELSPFMIALQNAEGNTTTNNQKDNTPKTGIVSSIYYILPITIISALGIVYIRRKQAK